MALQVDSLSGGRLILGLGAGWQEREHEHFGYDLLDIGPRFDRFGEALVVITELMESDDPVSFSGEYYQLRDAILLPRPKRPGGPPVLIGGNGPKYTLPKVAQYADEWNAAFIPPERFKELNARLDHLLEVGGRPAGDVRRSLAQHTLFAPDNARLKEKLNGRKVAELRKRGTIVGTPSGDIVDQIQARAEAGVQRLMLQWLDLDDMDGLEALAQAVL
jgi:alkanesulfonate monooxygenase SsuD/methylene tetrahydromethanopterin reductase-like flavin-dependent oxidoreductase (luciferase family)